MVIAAIGSQQTTRLSLELITGFIRESEITGALYLSERAQAVLAEVPQQPDLCIKTCHIERVSIQMGSVTPPNDLLQWLQMAQRALPTGRVLLPRLLGLHTLLHLRDLPQLDEQHTLPVTALTVPIFWRARLWQFQARVFEQFVALEGIQATPVSLCNPLIALRDL